ncbi:cyclin-dependent kinase 4 inhibitor D isoform X1 [Notolabrus celidotus]|uniref:cyclin-dependent kinase 4 inhibitor D isoform X1 n=1 Tax=Notolabrus celidotus TaxID=1203425 RepID=UPI00148F66B3|nr:cyclin-dependent kinase 4 inhibitor D isoform X1 [Notolabrus celidotus]
MAMTREDELTAAAAKGNTAAVEELLRKGAQVDGLNRFGRTALQVRMRGSTQVARLLLEHGANPNVADCTTGHTPLHDAARAGFLDTVRLLIEFNANPQATDNANCRPVHLAIKHSHTDVVDFLDSLENAQ